jgi:hypothetical protein
MDRRKLMRLTAGFPETKPSGRKVDSGVAPTNVVQAKYPEKY